MSSDLESEEHEDSDTHVVVESTLEGPEEVRVRLGINLEDEPSRSDELISEGVVDGKTMSVGEPRVATAEREPSNTDRLNSATNSVDAVLLESSGRKVQAAQVKND